MSALAAPTSHFPDLYPNTVLRNYLTKQSLFIWGMLNSSFESFATEDQELLNKLFFTLAPSIPANVKCKLKCEAVCHQAGKLFILTSDISMKFLANSLWQKVEHSEMSSKMLLFFILSYPILSTFLEIVMLNWSNFYSFNQATSKHFPASLTLEFNAISRIWNSLFDFI